MDIILDKLPTPSISRKTLQKFIPNEKDKVKEKKLNIWINYLKPIFR